MPYLIKIKNLILDCRNLRICARETFTNINHNNNSTQNVLGIVFWFFLLFASEKISESSVKEKTASFAKGDNPLL